MKLLTLIFSCISFLQADMVLVESLACKELKSLKNIPEEISSDYMKLNIYAMSHDCALISKKDKIQAHEYNEHKKNDPFTKIYLKKSGRILFIPSQNILVEQPGTGIFTYSR